MDAAIFNKLCNRRPGGAGKDCKPSSIKHDTTRALPRQWSVMPGSSWRWRHTVPQVAPRDPGGASQDQQLMLGGPRALTKQRRETLQATPTTSLNRKSSSKVCFGKRRRTRATTPRRRRPLRASASG
ncbi:hypothetical protein BU26DRAFT_518414 [Trematosphaeria pertusa]|uniref:Uncharacterized protein n=1 Tax=Trematosphaeria pertusa TaxID=390896 RepID=A0A6A6IIM3_9PLEO|nr:uncharacterized protein BU26DRAFT_518414 [Trematosphaeria pertusa]KAF2249898.1 hypothetical protein BU26DRAFT_518414 [Trematosphaeria pertusa]